LQNNDSNQCIYCLEKWLSAASLPEIIYPLFDNRLDDLKKIKAWEIVVHEIKSRYSRHYKSPNTFVLDSLRCEDQRYRTLEVYILGLSGFFREYETFDFENYTTTEENLETFDSLNINTLLDILEKNGFPKISEVGQRNVKGTIHILIHSGDTSFMQKYLPIIEQRCLEGEAQWEHYVMLTDRNLRKRGLPQEYGTQFEFVNLEKTELMMAPIDDLILVNKRRAKLGLGRIPPEEVTNIIKVKSR